MLLWKWKQDDTTCLLGQPKSKTLATPNDGTVTPKENNPKEKEKDPKIGKRKNNKIVVISSGVLINTLNNNVSSKTFIY